MRVIRTQWPVGQGCFATGIIDADGQAPFHYAYDCGARNPTKLKPVVQSYAEGVRRLDALFISHLDSDHVEGLDTLLARTEATAVYLPYLDLVQRVIAIVEAEIDGSLTASLVEAQLDPAGWFGRRGVREVIFVGPGTDGASPFRDGGGEGSPFSGPDDSKERVVVERFGQVGALNESTEAALGEDRARLLQMSLGGHLAAQRGTIRLWLLVPYVPRVDQARLNRFRTELMKVLKVGADRQITAKLLQAKLSTPEGRGELRSCYEEIVDGGSGAKHNEVSMSLYSGPATLSGDRSIFIRHEGTRGWWGHLHRPDQIGWIGAGDAKLRNDGARKQWEQFYQHLLTLTGTMLLPHHGSRKNFHADLLKHRSIRNFIAAADERNKGYKHPSPEVVFAIDDARRLLLHVTKSAASRVVELCRLG